MANSRGIGGSALGGIAIGAGRSTRAAAPPAPPPGRCRRGGIGASSIGARRCSQASSSPPPPTGGGQRAWLGAALPCCCAPDPCCLDGEAPECWLVSFNVDSACAGAVAAGHVGGRYWFGRRFVQCGWDCVFPEGTGPNVWNMLGSLVIGRQGDGWVVDVQTYDPQFWFRKELPHQPSCWALDEEPLVIPNLANPWGCDPGLLSATIQPAAEGACVPCYYTSPCNQGHRPAYYLLTIQQACLAGTYQLDPVDGGTFWHYEYDDGVVHVDIGLLGIRAWSYAAPPLGGAIDFTFPELDAYPCDEFEALYCPVANPNILNPYGACRHDPLDLSPALLTGVPWP